MAVINYISQIFGPVESLGMEIQTIQSAMAGIHRINEFFKRKRKKRHTRQYGYRETDIPVEFKDVTFGYDENVVLDHVKISGKRRRTSYTCRTYQEPVRVQS